MPGFVIHDFGGHNVRVDSRREYYYTYMWEVTTVLGFSLREGDALITLKEVTLPTFTVNKEIYNSGIEYKFAKNVTWDDIRLTWYDTKGLLPYMRQWRQSVWDLECGLRTANNYKKDTSISTYLSNGESVVQWKLFNSWPSMIRHGDLTYANSDIKIVEVTVTYDWAEEDWRDSSGQAPPNIPNPSLGAGSF